MAEDLNRLLAELPHKEDGGFGIVQDYPSGVSFRIGRNPAWTVAVNENYAAANAESGRGASFRAGTSGYRAVSAYAGHVLRGGPRPGRRKLRPEPGPRAFPPETASWSGTVKGEGWIAGKVPVSGRTAAYAFTGGRSSCVADGAGLGASVRRRGKWLAMSFPESDRAGYPITPERAAEAAESTYLNAELVRRKEAAYRTPAAPEIPNPDFRAVLHAGNLRSGKRTVVITGSFAESGIWPDGTRRKRTKFRVWAEADGTFRAEVRGKTIEVRGNGPDQVLLPAVDALRDVLNGKGRHDGKDGKGRGRKKRAGR